ncbi:Ger(x)C family spore germination protein [Paenibacillus sepulcri]|uniref:Ger(X)C family spore germination protein n=1 Tax=Paenibacillus sepulcri TaxID=359917 RepID=A0ABS7BZE4_9BACL|nr:Ger(x)C family spore germination protein [Paenibacillus sepulcri]
MRWIALLLCACLLGGCSGKELIERGFILGVALDLDENDNLILTSQFYKPSRGETDPSGSYVNIRTGGSTMFDAARNITMRLGRKAQWSHMQTILVGEKMVKSERWKEVLDFFYRDDEPRLTTRIAVTKGDASSYLYAKPYMETTISRQTHEVEGSSYYYSGKTIQMSLLDLRLELDSAVETAVLPYMTFDDVPRKNPYFKGAAVVNKNKMIELLKANEVEAYHMLKNTYREGIIVLPCGESDKGDSIEVVSFHTKLSTRLKQGIPQVHAAIKVNVTVRELICHSLATTAEAYAYQGEIVKQIEKQLTSFTQAMKKSKIDLLGIGNGIHQHHPREWETMKKDWGDHLKQAEFKFDIKVSLSNTGLEDGKSALDEGG